MIEERFTISHNVYPTFVYSYVQFSKLYFAELIVVVGYCSFRDLLPILYYINNNHPLLTRICSIEN